MNQRFVSAAREGMGAAMIAAATKKSRKARADRMGSSHRGEKAGFRSIGQSASFSPKNFTAGSR
jgi:hypothetical protein